MTPQLYLCPNRAAAEWNAHRAKRSEARNHFAITFNVSSSHNGSPASNKEFPTPLIALVCLTVERLSAIDDQLAQMYKISNIIQRDRQRSNEIPPGC
jgi:hypothetical protein